MNDTYTNIIVILISAVLCPALAVAVLKRPRPFKYVLRGGESAVCLAIAIDTIRRLMLITSGVLVAYPGDVWAVLNIVMLSVSGILLWARVAQITRHSLRDREHGRLLTAELDKQKGTTT